MQETVRSEVLTMKGEYWEQSQLRIGSYLPCLSSQNPVYTGPPISIFITSPSIFFLLFSLNNEIPSPGLLSTLLFTK
jgi:hypothetical protein